MPLALAPLVGKNVLESVHRDRQGYSPLCNEGDLMRPSQSLKSPKSASQAASRDPSRRRSFSPLASTGQQSISPRSLSPQNMSDFGGINGTQVQTPRASVIAARLKSFLTDNQGSAETDRVMPPGSRDMQDSRQSSKRRSTKEARSDSKEDAPLAERPGHLRRATVDARSASKEDAPLAE